MCHCHLIASLSNAPLFISVPTSDDLTIHFLIQWKPLSVITLGQKETDNSNRMIILTKQDLRLVYCKEETWAFDNIHLLITLTE
jgi:hypothetical protein